MASQAEGEEDARARATETEDSMGGYVLPKGLTEALLVCTTARRPLLLVTMLSEAFGKGVEPQEEEEDDDEEEDVDDENKKTTKKTEEEEEEEEQAGSTQCYAITRCAALRAILL